MGLMNSWLALGSIGPKKRTNEPPAEPFVTFSPVPNVMELGVTVGDSIERIGETGEAFDFVEFGLSESAAIPEEIDKNHLEEACRTVGVDLDVHLPFKQVVATPVPELNEAIVDYQKRLLSWAGDVGARKAVLHATVRNPSDTSLRPLFADQLSAIVETGRDVGVEVVVENVGHQKRGLPLSVLGELASETGSSVCFDIGHAYMEGGNDAVERFLDEYSDLVSHLHVHDARSRGDTHIPLGAGEVEYRLLEQYFAEFDGTTAVEVFTDDVALLKDTANRLSSVLTDAESQ